MGIFDQDGRTSGIQNEILWDMKNPTDYKDPESLTSTADDPARSQKRGRARFWILTGILILVGAGVLTLTVIAVIKLFPMLFL